MKTGKPGGGISKSSTGKLQATESTPLDKTLLAGDLVKSLTQLGDATIQLLREKERTKQVYIESAARVELARLDFEKEHLNFKAKIEELRNIKDDNALRRKSIEACIEYRDNILVQLNYLLRMNVGDSESEREVYRMKLNILIELFKSASNNSPNS